MSRMKKGEKGHDKAVSKWWSTMMERFGSKEAVHDHMVAMGKKGGKLSQGGGFASEKVGPDGLTGRERARLVGAIGGLKSTRVGVRNGEGKNARRTENEGTGSD